MKISSFIRNTESETTVANTGLGSTQKQKEVDYLLSVVIGEGRTLLDHLMSKDLASQIDANLYTAFVDLIGEEINSYRDMRNSLLEQIENGESSVLGLINKIKGQIGQLAFAKQARQFGLQIELADANSNQGWDLAINEFSQPQFLQIKLDHDDETIGNEIIRVTDKLAEGSVVYNNKIVERIDFAVPDYAYDLVVQNAYDENIDVHVLCFGRTEGKYFGLAGLFADLFAPDLSWKELQNLVDAFLAYKGAKEIDAFLNDRKLQSSISTIHAGSGSLANSVLRKISIAGGIPIGLLAPAVSRTAQTVATHTISGYRDMNWMTQQNSQNKVLVAS